jgi:predicted nucleic acid-binding protein
VRSFIDTNVLVYADDGGVPARQAIAVDLIVQAARQSGCVQLLSENTHSGAMLAGVRLVNPFSTGVNP